MAVKRIEREIASKSAALVKTVYGDESTEARVSLVAGLFSAGFTKQEILTYLKARSLVERLRILEAKRAFLMEDIHRGQRALCQVDYLRWLERRQEP